MQTQALFLPQFPFLFGGTFIEARIAPAGTGAGGANFPSFSEGLSLRPAAWFAVHSGGVGFPFLFGGTFIEAYAGTNKGVHIYNFPSFSEGLSLRPYPPVSQSAMIKISLPFRRDFH